MTLRLKNIWKQPFSIARYWFLLLFQWSIEKNCSERVWETTGFTLRWSGTPLLLLQRTFGRYNEKREGLHRLRWRWKAGLLWNQGGRHKTMAAQMHRHQYLPMVAPVKGVNGADWSTPWMNLRTAMGIELPPDGLLMPAPNQHGEVTERPLESGECGKWLRRLLNIDTAFGPSSERRVSSHSLKCTMLSFAANQVSYKGACIYIYIYSTNVNMYNACTYIYIYIQMYM